MGLKEKLKSIGKIIILSSLGFVCSANIYTEIDFQKHMNYIKENPGSFGRTGDRILYASMYNHKNKKFPNNIITFLSRQEAKNFIKDFYR